MLRLTRVIVRTKGGSHRVSADYRTEAGKRVRLGQGDVHNLHDLGVLVRSIAISARNSGELTPGRGM